MVRFALSISAGLAVVSVVLTTLWVSHGPRPANDQAKKTSEVPISQQRTTGSNGQPIRSIATAPSSGSSLSDVSAQKVTPAVPEPPLATNLQSDAYSAPPVNLDPPADGRSPSRLADATPVSGAGTATTVNSANDPSGTAGGTVDLNSASVDQLNALGAGMIGKRILEYRPYASTDELLSRRVLKRSDYETIKAAVTAR